MEMKKLSKLVIDFFRNDIVWLVFTWPLPQPLSSEVSPGCFFPILQEA
jgi:hypothetical protein